MPVFFNGRLHISPAVLTKVEDSRLANQNLSVGNILAIIGKSEGGEPATGLRFGSPLDARSVLRSGEGLVAVEKAFDPSAETGGPAEVVFVRVNPALQSSLTLQDGSSNNVITLQSTDYGTYTNGIKVKVESGTNTGKRLTTQFGNDYYTEDDVARDAFSLQYTGAGAAATITVSNTTVTLTVDGTPTAITLSSYPKMSQLVDYINTITDFTATLLDDNGNRATESGLDSVTTQDVKSAAYTVTANLQAVVDWFNGLGEGFLDATRVASAGDVPANIAFTYLSGGSDGVTTNTEWQAAFDALQSIDVQWVVPVSPDASIHAMADTHATFMSNVARMERRVLVGPASGTTDVSAIALAKALNSDRTSLTHLGFYDFDDDGVLVLREPYIMAALLGGGFAGVNPGTALTRKTVKIRGIERNLRNPTDTDALITGGVLCVESTNTGYRVVQSITTWLANSNYNRVEVSVGVAVDFVSRNVRNALEPLLGAKGDPISIASAISRTETALRQLAQPEPLGPGVLVGDAINPAYKNISAKLVGDVLTVEFEASPVIPINYIPIVIHAVPYTGSLAA
ncbi:MAG: hypothetical protein ACU843_12845 [Gammaproteobacteria bacterium]